MILTNKEKIMTTNDTVIIYLGMTTNVQDNPLSVTTGTSTIGGMDCREWQKHMSIFWVHCCDSNKTKGQWEYWEKNHLSPWISCLLEESRVVYDRQQMNGRCNGRTDNWWLLTTTQEELIEHVKEKIARG
tara:strand:- start:126 stop:515 length:390 start_codon:yes stop_codon:yes gene_type:complete